MKILHSDLATAAIKTAQSGTEVPGYAIFVFIRSVNRIIIAPRNGYTHGWLLMEIRNDLSAEELSSLRLDQGVYTGFVAWEEGDRMIRSDSGSPLPMEIAQRVNTAIESLSGT